MSTTTILSLSAICLHLLVHCTATQNSRHPRMDNSNLDTNHLLAVAEFDKKTFNAAWNLSISVNLLSLYCAIFHKTQKFTSNLCLSLSTAQRPLKPTATTTDSVMTTTETPTEPTAPPQKCTEIVHNCMQTDNTTCASLNFVVCNMLRPTDPDAMPNCSCMIMEEMSAPCTCSLDCTDAIPSDPQEEPFYLCNSELVFNSPNIIRRLYCDIIILNGDPTFICSRRSSFF